MCDNKGMKKSLIPLGLAVAMLALSSCASAPVEPASVQRSPAPVIETAKPSPSPEPTPESTPTPKPSPTLEPEPLPTKTAIPLPIPTPTLKPTPTPTKPTVTIKLIDEVLYATQEVNVRNGPGVQHKVIDSLQSGDELPVDAESEGWKRIAGSELWVSGKYLTKTKPVPQDSTKELTAEIRQILKTYQCPSAKIILDDPRLGEYSNGVADWHANTILVRSTLPKERLTYVVAHECMHLRQYNVYGGDLEKLSADMNKVYGGYNFDGLEENADCMTKAVGISTYHYTTECGGERGRAAKKLLSGSTL